MIFYPIGHEIISFLTMSKAPMMKMKGHMLTFVIRETYLSINHLLIDDNRGFFSLPPFLRRFDQ